MEGTHMRILLLALLMFTANSSLAQTTPVKKAEPPEPQRVGTPDDVPVVPSVPKKVEKVEKEKAEPESSDHAILPVSMVKNTVHALKVGSTAYVAFEAVRIDARRKMWLHPTFVTGQKTKERPVQIRRDADGFHIVLEQVEHQWEAEDVDGIASKWIPARSVLVKE